MLDTVMNMDEESMVRESLFGGGDLELGNGKMATIYLGCEARELGRVPEPP